MQNVSSISLNALRVFLVTAQHLSIKKAAELLHVTPGAVSHQIKTLEKSLGVLLFTRTNNKIALTDAGTQLRLQSAPSLQMLHSALENTIRSNNELRVGASMSFAVRWLIPRLYQFKTQNPGTKAQVETFFDIDQLPNSAADVTIRYYRRDECPRDADILFEDACRPYLSPALLSKRKNPSDLSSIPALQCTTGNWDWQLWLEDANRSETELNFAESFDLDDAALRAASTGMGMVLTSDFMIKDALGDGRLVPIPDSEETVLGYYTLHSGARDSGLSERFIRWLRGVAETDR